MNVLFVHPNFPGQYRKLAASFAQIPGLRVFALADADWIGNRPPFPNITHWTYRLPESPDYRPHPYAAPFHEATRRADAAAGAILQQKRQGFEPDVIFVHPGWGDAFFLKEIFPFARIYGHMEYYYHTHGADVGFDPEFPRRFQDGFRLHCANAVQLLALESCDEYITSTQWQRSRYPTPYQARMHVIHEGVDTETLAPKPEASLTLPNGQTLHRGEPIVTYAARDLEPVRGIHTFLRALPTLFERRPDAIVLIAGRHGVSYGRPLPEGETYQGKYWAEIRDCVPVDRVHFLGWLERDQLDALYQISAVHAYLTYPFVLSWSFVEALSCGCLIVGSDTEPVRELLSHEDNGLLVPFHDPKAWGETLALALDRQDELVALRERARRTAVERFDYRLTLQAYLRLLGNVLSSPR